jgi:hypothetical protein
MLFYPNPNDLWRRTKNHVTKKNGVQALAKRFYDRVLWCLVNWDKMGRPLDFIIFGVARSGTKGLVRALNLHPHIYCAMERFHFRANHSRLTFPESFLDANSLGGRDDSAKIKHIAAEIAHKRDVRRAGNKLPRYYFALDRINREVPAIRNIWIYRTPYDFIPSWNVREQTRSQSQWPAGQIGLFGVLELLICIQNCLTLRKEILVFPYRHGLGWSTRSVLDVIDFVDVDSKIYDTAGFAEMQRNREEKRRKQSAGTRLPLRDYEEEFLATLRIRDLDDIMEQGRVVKLSEIAKPLRDFLGSIGNVLPTAIDRAFRACTNPTVVAFGQDHFNRNRAEFFGLVSHTSGSKALAQFQKLSALPRISTFFRQYLNR